MLTRVTFILGDTLYSMTLARLLIDICGYVALFSATLLFIMWVWETAVESYRYEKELDEINSKYEKFVRDTFRGEDWD